jgi:hypothetical protein
LNLDPNRLSSCHARQHRNFVLEVIHCSTFENFPHCRASDFGPDISAVER